jgi:hypothetical protein
MVQNSRNSSGYYYGALGQEGCARLKVALENSPSPTRKRHFTDVDAEWYTSNENPGGQEQQYHQGALREHCARLTKRRVMRRIEESESIRERERE